MNTFFKHFQLKPYGNLLLAPSAESWLFSACIIVLVMALSEAVAWSYLGYLFADGILRGITAAACGTAIFLVIWMIDVSLITHDAAAREHAITILGERPSSRSLHTLRTVFTVLLRIGILAGSFTITAPYLAQLVFRTDIESFIANEATASLETARERITQSFDKRLSEKETEIREKRSALEREVAGKGLSERYGNGSASKAIADQLAILGRERDVLSQQKVKALDAFAALSQDWRQNREKLSAQYNVSLPRNSVLENGHALEELRKRPEDKATERAIQAFLALIFAALLLLKLFEPRSVRLYLSAVLQEQYKRYLRGSFDSLLEPGDKPVNGYTMPPQQLYQFLIKVWAPTQRVHELDLETHMRSRMAEKTLEGFKDFQTALEKDYNDTRSAYTRAEEAAKMAAENEEHFRSAVDIVQKDIKLFTERLAAGEQALFEDAGEFRDDESRLRYDKSRLETLSKWKNELAKANIALSGLLTKGETVSAAATHSKGVHRDLDKKLRSKEKDLEHARARILAVRRHFAGSASDNVVQ